MKILCVAMGAALLGCPLSSFAQTESTCGQTLDAPLRSRAVLTIDSRPAGLEIVGTDRQVIHVSCTVKDIQDAGEIRLRLSGDADRSKLTITGGSLKDGSLQIHIEVPHKSSLRVKMAAGEVKVEELAGDKDIHLYAGQISISSARPWVYRNVDLSVDIGAVKAPAYGADKGGFFPHFKESTADGEYGLHAHVGTGEIDLRTNTSGAAE